MNEITEGLKKFRIERNMNNMKFDLYVQTNSLLKEVSEYLDAVEASDEYEMVDALCDIAVFAINDYNMLVNEDIELYKYFINNSIYDIIYNISQFNISTTKQITSCLVYIISSCHCMVGSLGYDFEKCMLETIKEISSRKQDPLQTADWVKNGVQGKWQKDRSQDPKTLYKADYEACRRL